MNAAEIDMLDPVNAMFETRGLSISIISCQESLDFGLIGCPGTVPDIGPIAQCMKMEYGILKTAARDA